MRSIIRYVESRTHMGAPTTTIQVRDLIDMKETEYRKHPARDACDGAKTHLKENRERVTHDSKTPTLWINDIYSIEVEIWSEGRGTWARMKSELDRCGSASSKTCRAGVWGARGEIATWAPPPAMAGHKPVSGV